MRGLIACALVLSACSGAEPEERDPDLELGRRFVEDQAFRREALERSLAFRDNDDAELRLARYAVPGGWDELPEQDPLVRPVGEDAAEMVRVWSGEVEWTRPALLELGRTAFELWPAQRLPELAYVARSPARASILGLWSDSRGRIGGAVITRYPDGSEQSSLTCSSCHARPAADGLLVHGPASDINLGALVGREAPGRVDVTADERDNPVSIPDLRATRHQRRLHWSANLSNGLDSLAVRIESLLVTSSSETVRPPRAVVFALALYVWSLGEEPKSRATDSPGAEVFERTCASCHAGPTGEGEPVPESVVGTDPAATLSSARGTGLYRVPSLHRLTNRTRLTHEGRFASVEAFLDPARAETDSAHPFGLSLDERERAELIGFLETF